MSRRRLSAATLVGLEELAEAPAAIDRDVGASVRRFTLDGDQLVVSLPLTSIRPNPHQPRRAFSEQSLRELADSIAEHGRVLQPILVRPAESSAPGDAAGFELVAGERRWRASKLAGLQVIRAIVDGVDNALSAEMALTENMAREDLTTMEAARGCEALRSAFGLSYAQIARRVGRDRTAISHLTRLLQLPDRAQALIEEGRLSPGHGSILLRLEDHDARRVLAILCADGGWSVRELERHVDARNAAPRAAPSSPPADQLAALQTMSESLEPIFGAIGVRIVPRRRGSYRIALDCESYDELAGIVARMRGLPSAAADDCPHRG